MKWIFESVARAAEQLERPQEALAAKLRLASTHWMRHTHASHALGKGADLMAVRDNLRHASIATTFIYLRSEDVKTARQMCLLCAPAGGYTDSRSMSSLCPIPVLGKAHARRLRDIYRSAGWPCQDPLEIELLAAGMLDRVQAPSGHESLRVTDAGVRLLAATLAANRAALTAHETLVQRVALEMSRAGRIAWRGLGLRARGPAADVGQPLLWRVARPDVFSIRNTSVERYVDPIVHEVKVRRADLLGDLRHEAKRAAYLDLGECWYVLGVDAKGRCIAEPQEVPAEYGVLVLQGERLVVARAAPRRMRTGLPFGVWMALAKATPVSRQDGEVQALLR